MNHQRIVGSLLAVAGLVLVLAAGLAPAQSAFESDFDHDSTGWPLEGSHRNVDCGTCHVAGIFEGTPRQCVACHSRGSLVQATGVPVNHLRTTDECDACHRQTDWAYVRRIDHNAVVGTCFSCHNGLTATGKPPAHIPTSSDCAVCHSTRAWSPAG